MRIRILENAKSYCSEVEKIENFELAKADNFKGWDCHHRLETHNSDGERRMVFISSKELKELDMYYNRPAEELIFLTRSEHQRLHLKGKKRKPFSEEWKRNMSEAKKGKPTWNKGLKGLQHHSEEAKRKLSKAAKGKHWYNNGVKSVLAFSCPDGFVPGRI